MRRLLVFLMAAMLGFAATSSLAVDKKKKTVPKTKTAKVVAKKKPAIKVVIPKPKPATYKKIDKFVDRNNNGIDDRREKLRPKTAAKKKPTATKVTPKKTKKTKKDSAKAVDKKKK